MTEKEVKRIVLGEIGDRWEETNSHRVDLRASLVKPTKRTIIVRLVQNGKIWDDEVDAWIVLEEDPVQKDGYKIVYQEKDGVFGLASIGFPEDKHLVLDGWYGDFWSAFKGM